MKVQFRKLSAPIGIQLELTPFCKNRCFHCYNYWRDTRSSLFKSMTRKEFIAAIDIVSKAKIFFITITGGEPLDVKPIWREVLKKIARCGLGCDMNSNLVNDLSGEDLLLMKDCGLFSILTSFHSYQEQIHDSITQNPGSFKKTVGNIIKLTDKGFNISVNMVVNKRNFLGVYETGKFLKTLGIKSFNATRVQEPVRDADFSSYKLSTEEIKLVLDQLFAIREKQGITVGSVTPYPFCFLAEDERLLSLPKRTCNAGITMASLEYTGSLRACPNSEKSYGNIFSDGLEKSWDKMQEWRDGLFIPKECKNCFYIAVCRGGCRANGMKEGVLNKKDELMSLPLTKNIEKTTNHKERSYSIEDRFSVCSKMKYRKENFGYTIAGYKISSPAFVSNLVFGALLKFKDASDFPIKSILQEWESDLLEAQEMLSYLEDKKVIIKTAQHKGATQ